MPVILIFDIGKTNKKMLLFNMLYEIVYEETVQLSETVDEDGFPCEDVHLLTSWIQQSFQKILANKSYRILAVNVSAYGASFVHVDENLQPCLPIYNYLKPFPDELLTNFYSKYDKNKSLAIETSSPNLGNLNSGLQLYWLKHTKPNNYKRIRCSLHLPQYISCIFSKKPYAEITSIGCHTMLWHFQQNNYHRWVNEEKISEQFPSFASSNTVTYVNNIAVGVGLHDSSAALIPYLTMFAGPYVLISTGTWCISLNPFDAEPLTTEDLEEGCLCYLSYKGKPVKASRLFAGNVHEQQIKRLADHFKVSADYYKTVRYNASLSGNFSSYLTKKEAKVLPAFPFVQTSLHQFISYEEAYHQLMVEIVEQQIQSTKKVIKNKPTKAIYVDGGFSKNEIYMSLLAQAFLNVPVYAATVAQASATGAAIAIHHAWNHLPVPSNLVSVQQYHPNIH